ncbi:MAG TPA: hypothetical protein VK009_10475 [Chloroflexota bacterium]|nr:hypothetical protein [Chloroflexota bacterium]
MTADVLAHYWTQAKQDLQTQAANPFPKQAPCTGIEAPIPPAPAQVFPRFPGCSRSSAWPNTGRW